MKGIIVEESLVDRKVLSRLQILKSWEDDGYMLHDVLIDESSIKDVQAALASGPWYVHFWEGDDITIVYKEKIFQTKKGDKTTWTDAIAYGESLGIPDHELTFITD